MQTSSIINKFANSLLSGALLLFLSCPVLAQGVLEEVIVTAQKREQSLQEVPIAVTAISSGELETLGLTDTKDLANHIPGLNISGTNNNSRPEVFLRGVGFEDFQSATGSPIQIYNDGVIVGGGFSGTTQLFDLDRVEVLKGPQGTLWGKNTTAGLINILPVQAEVGGEFNGYGKVTVAEFETYNFEGAVGLPLGENAAVRLSYQHNQNDGFQNNISGPGGFNGDTAGSNWDVFRGQLAWQANEKFGGKLVVLYSHLDGDPLQAKALGSEITSFAPFTTVPCANSGQLGSTCPNSFGLIANHSAEVSEADYKGFENSESVTVALHWDYDINFATLTSITSYQESDRQVLQDDGIPADTLFGPCFGFCELLSFSFDDEYDAWTQELRLASNNAGPLQWQVGAYYQNDEMNYYRSNYIFGFSAGRSNDIKSEIFGIFGEGTYDITDSLTLTAGVRFTWDERDASAFVTQVFSNGNNFGKFLTRQILYDPAEYDIISINNEMVNETFKEPSARVAATYALNENVNLFVIWSRGFRGGDVNAGAQNAGTFNLSEPEFLNAVEGGIKAILLDGSLRLNLSAYYYDYSDKVLFIEVPNPNAPGNISIIGNGEQVDITGFEAETSWLITENFAIDAGFSWIDATLEKVGFTVPFQGSIEGNTTANTPEFSFDFILNYQHPLPNGGKIHASFDGAWQDDVFFTNANRTIESQEEYWMLGASLGYISPGDNWDARIWVKNLGDEEYLVDAFDFGFETFGYPGAPRQVGGSISYRF